MNDFQELKNLMSSVHVCKNVPEKIVFSEETAQKGQSLA